MKRNLHSSALIKVPLTLLFLCAPPLSRAQTPDWTNLVPVTVIPTNGNFFSMQLNPSPPLPVDPYPDLPLYTSEATPDDYWYDDWSVDYGSLSTRRHHRSGVIVGGGGSVADDETLPTPGGGIVSGTNVWPLIPIFIPPAPGYVPCQTYTNFWIQLSESGSTGGEAAGIISNTLPGLEYLLLQKTNLTEPAWAVIQTFTATNFFIPFTVASAGTNTLFLYAVLSTNNFGPVIVTGPTNEVVALGGSATFTVTAEGNPAVSYQWSLDGTNISGATASAYTISSVSSNNLGLYTVLVSNAICEAGAGAGLGLVWSNNLGAAIDASPAIDAAGNVYIATRGNNLFALDAAGNVKWFTTDIVTGQNSDITSSAALAADGSALYIGTENSGAGFLDAFNPTNGNLLWQVAMTNQISSTPAVSAGDGTIYVTSLGGDGRGLFSINPATHLTNWFFLPDSDTSPTLLDSSPAIGPDCTIYFLGDSDLYAVSPNGNLAWFFPLPSGGIPNASPAIDGSGNILVGSFDGYVYCVSPMGALRWIFDTGTGEPIQSSIAVGSNGLVVAGTDAGIVFALTNGVEAWAFTNTSGAAFISSPAISADGVVVIGCEDSLVYGLTNGAIKWTFQAAGPIVSSPAISPVSGAVFIGSEDFDGLGSLYALPGVSALANSPWPMFHENPNHTGAAPHPGCPATPSSVAFLSNPSVNTNSSPSTFTCEVSGTPGSGWAIFASSDLTNWDAVGSAQIGDNGMATGGFEDTNIDGFTNRFYQAHFGFTCSPVILGYVNITIPTGTNLLGDPLYQINDGDFPQNTATGWLQFLLNDSFALPDQAVLMEWNGTGFDLETNSRVADEWLPNGDNTMLPGRSVFFVNPGPAITVPFAGLIGQSSTKLITPGINYVSSMIPKAGGVHTDLGYNPNNGDEVLLWNGTNFVTNTYSSGAWSPSEPSVKIGEGFVIVAGQSNVWTQSFSACEPLLTVTADPVWTDTGLVISNGQLAVYGASGTWTGGNGNFCGPGGKLGASLDPFLTNALGFSLIAFVGPDPFFSGSTFEWISNNTFFPQDGGNNGYFALTNVVTTNSTNWVFQATQTGELWYGFNDDANQLHVSDNFGVVVGPLVITNSP